MGPPQELKLKVKVEVKVLVKVKAESEPGPELEEAPAPEEGGEEGGGDQQPEGATWRGKREGNPDLRG